MVTVTSPYWWDVDRTGLVSPRKDLWWRVEINDLWAYQVEAPWAAEAEYAAVRYWRTDPEVPEADRRSFIFRITTECEDADSQ